MEKFENVDVLKTLEAIMRQNTAFYQTDFQYDKDMFWKSAVLGGPEDKTFLWLSRSSGTQCYHERDIFLRDTYPHNSWLYYGERSRDHVLAYAVELTDTECDVIRGSIYPLDYDAHWRRVKEEAIRPDETRLIFQNGETHTFPFEQYEKEFGRILAHYGGVKEAAHLLDRPERIAEILKPYREERAGARAVKVGPHIQRLQREKVQIEASRILTELQKPHAPNSPNKTHFMTEVSRCFLNVANSDEQSRLFDLLPFSSLMLTRLKDRDGLYAMISKDEDRSQPLRKPSVRKRLQEHPSTPDAPKHPGKPKKQER